MLNNRLVNWNGWSEPESVSGLEAGLNEREAVAGDDGGRARNPKRAERAPSPVSTRKSGRRLRKLAVMAAVRMIGPR